MRKKSALKQLAILWSKFLTLLIQAGGFVSYIDQDITGENFPLQDDDLKFKPVKIISIKEYSKSLGGRWPSTDEVKSYLAELGYRPATLAELLLWWLDYLATTYDFCLIVALGSIWHGSAPCIRGAGRSRGLDIKLIEVGWPADYEFAAVELEKKAA